MSVQTKPLSPTRIAQQADIGRVIAWMSGALLSFCVMAVSVRELASVISVFEIMTIRTSTGLLILSAMLVISPPLRRHIRRYSIGAHVLRNGTHYAAQVCWMIAVTLLPLATVFALEFTAPIWVALFAVLFLGERLTSSRLGTIIAGFAGVCLIVRPGVESFQPAALFALAAAFGYAIAAVLTKRLTRDESTFAILFWMNLIQLPPSLLASDPWFWTHIGAQQALPFGGLVVAGLTSHFCLANAFRAGDALIVVPIDFIRIPLIALIGWSLYGESVDVLVFAGTGLIMAGVLWNLWNEARSERRPLDQAGL